MKARNVACNIWHSTHRGVTLKLAWQLGERCNLQREPSDEELKARKSSAAGSRLLHELSPIANVRTTSQAAPAVSLTEPRRRGAPTAWWYGQL